MTIKKLSITILTAAALALAACETSDEKLAGGDEPVTATDDECPRADGEACR